MIVRCIKDYPGRLRTGYCYKAVDQFTNGLGTYYVIEQDDKEKLITYNVLFFMDQNELRELKLNELEIV